MATKLTFIGVTDAFNHIGATTKAGEPYGTARGISVSADKRHFRFWEEDLIFGDDQFVELHRVPPQHSTWRNEPQGKAFYEALVQAYKSAASIYVTINRRGKRDQDDNSVATAAAPVLTAVGLPAPGRVLFADPESGEVRVRFLLSASSAGTTFFTDQFDAHESPVFKTVTHSIRFARNPAVRFRVLVRAAGICERPSCHSPGFETLSGIYLETHHVIPLSDNGGDSTDNVVALCANCHRMAHYWIDRDSIRSELMQWLKGQGMK